MDLELKVSKALKVDSLHISQREYVSVSFEVFEQNNRHYITLTFPKYLADKTREILSDALRT